MAHKYAQLAFTETVRAMQQEQNSRAGYASMDQGEDYNFLLSAVEAEFIAQRDSLYMASVSETDWPYVQHRGGPKGFLKVLDASTLGFADYKGNRQYVSAGNFRNNDRVALIFVDYPNKRRLKLMGRISQVAEDDWQTLASLEDDHYRAKVERGFVIKVEAFDWNCPQHITPRYSESELESFITPLTNELSEVKAQLKSQQLAFSSNEASSQDSSLPKVSFADYPQISGEGELPLVISGIRQLTPRIRAIELKHAMGETLPAFEAGAHLAIPVVLSDGKITHRHYSLCSNPSRTDCYEIAVLKHHKDLKEANKSNYKESDQSGSELIHQHFTLGLRLNCSQPQNYFPLEQSTSPVILIAGGIGITPIKAMALTLTSQQRDFSLHYCGRSIDEMAFSDRLSRQLGDKLHLYASDEGKKLNLDKLLISAPAKAHFYFCGPQKMIDQLLYLAQKHGIESSRLHFERFEHKLDATAKSFMLKLNRSAKQFTVSAQESVLDAVLAQGINVPYSCKTGECKTCVVSVVKGNIIHKDECLTNTDKVNKLMCLCVSRAAQDTLELDL
ncbi:2Fe-2S iron-sulfur cluster binding domain-containing protein [Colwellia demingiae]|uniref:2Fe-2S iron-sulfur cluster binding domain-containing protein n=1 Tax=Colwellia demingiae TaxID=89401 RepID=A0A5C6Q5Q5_9GAMM|nr:2Fe-2S iron-sulfur cluster-binding protein [Colwellia demingiae]TWX63947.1 2Fe-2S iron-sulfur cluster binding domain-containing protein [Colwellia demingiae]